jgi:hypothetical protein
MTVPKSRQETAQGPERTADTRLGGHREPAHCVCTGLRYSSAAFSTGCPYATTPGIGDYPPQPSIVRSRKRRACGLFVLDRAEDLKCGSSYIEFGGTEGQGISLPDAEALVRDECADFLIGLNGLFRANDRLAAVEFRRGAARTQFGNRSKNIFRVEARTDVPMGIVLRPGKFFGRTNRRSPQGTDCVDQAEV